MIARVENLKWITIERYSVYPLYDESGKVVAAKSRRKDGNPKNWLGKTLPNVPAQMTERDKQRLQDLVDKWDGNPESTDGWVVDKEYAKKHRSKEVGEKKNSKCGANTGEPGFGKGNTCAAGDGKVPVKVDEKGDIHDGPENLKGKNLSDLHPDAKKLAKEYEISEEKANEIIGGQTSNDDWDFDDLDDSFDFGSESTKEKPAFEPKTKLEKAIVEDMGDDPELVEGMKKAVTDAYEMHLTELEEKNEPLRQLLSHFGLTGRRLSGFLAGIKRAQDPDSVPGFDEMVQVAASTYPMALTTSGVSGSHSNSDPETLLFDRLNEGFIKPLAKHSRDLIDKAKKMVGWSVPFCAIRASRDTFVERFASVWNSVLIERFGQRNLFDDGNTSDRDEQTHLFWASDDGRSHCGANIKGGGGFQKGNHCGGTSKQQPKSGESTNEPEPESTDQEVGEEPTDDSDSTIPSDSNDETLEGDGFELTSGEKEIANSDNPRDQATREVKYYDQGEYEWAKKSEVKNAGEDLKGSARHTRNLWRSIDDIESAGVVEALKAVQRDKLLKSQGFDITDAINDDQSNILDVLAMHLAMKKFPSKPTDGKSWKSRAVRNGEYESDEAYEKMIRSEYFSMFEKYRDKVIELAHDESLTQSKKLTELGKFVSDEMKPLRSKVPALYNQFVTTSNGLRYGKTSVGSQVDQFLRELHKVHPESVTLPSRYDYTRKTELKDPTLANDYAMKILEGKSLKAAFGIASSRSGKKKIHVSEMYVEHAERTGGQEFPANNTEKNTNHLLKDMQVRGIQFGNSMTDRERKHHLAKTNEAFSDMADVCGIPIESIGINGKLGLAFGARGRAGALAHYEPDSKVINLTRRSGAGSLAHEWAHFMDHLMAGGELPSISDGLKGSRPYLSHGRNVSDDMKQAAKALLESWHSTGFYDRVQQRADIMLGGGAYWTSHHEMFARSFERYVQKKLHDSGRENTYLTGVKKSNGGFWPTDEEVDDMAPHFEKILQHFHANIDKYSAILGHCWYSKHCWYSLDTQPVINQ